MATTTFKTPTRAVSMRMQRIRSSGTSIERRMSGILNELDIKYDIQTKLYGHPDFKLIGTNILIFCDGSFWHGRNKADLSGKSFGRNARFWKDKINYNFRRDSKINLALKKDGWVVVRFWDTDINKRPNYVKARILEKFLHARKS